VAESQFDVEGIHAPDAGARQRYRNQIGHRRLVAAFPDGGKALLLANLFCLSCAQHQCETSRVEVPTVVVEAGIVGLTARSQPATSFDVQEPNDVTSATWRRCYRYPECDFPCWSLTQQAHEGIAKDCISWWPTCAALLGLMLECSTRIFPAAASERGFHRRRALRQGRRACYGIDVACPASSSFQIPELN